MGIAALSQPSQARRIVAFGGLRRAMKAVGMSQLSSTPPPSREVVVQLMDPTFGRPIKSWTFTQKASISIGREVDRDVEISDAYVSRNHAELQLRGEQWVLVSKGRNGVVVANQLITEFPVEGDVNFRLGPSGPSLRFRTTPVEDANLATICFDTLPPPMFQLDTQKLQEDVGAIAEGDYFQKLQQRAKQLRQRKPD